MGKILDNANKVKDKYEQYNQKSRRRDCEDLANIIITFKGIKHYVVKTPEALRKKKEHAKLTNENKSFMDFIEEPDDSESIEEIADKLEQKYDRAVDVTKKVNNYLNPIFWAKKAINYIKNKIKKDDTKLLNDGDKQTSTIEETNKSNSVKSFNDSLIVSKDELENNLNIDNNKNEYTKNIDNSFEERQ